MTEIYQNFISCFISKLEHLFSMARYRIKDPKAIVSILLFTIFLSAFIILFTMGGAFFSNENPKMKYYAQSTCQVQSRFYRTYECKSKYFRYTCYSPTWDALYGANLTKFAVVETAKRYRSTTEALDKGKQYEVKYC